MYGGVVDAWSFPLDLSAGTVLYTSDVRAPFGGGRVCAGRCLNGQ
jgi:hypothetical protein